MENTKGQFSSFDMALVLLAITVSIAVIAGFSGGSAKEAQVMKVRNDFTHSLLVSMLQCSVDSGGGYENKTVSDLVVSSFQDPRLNLLVTREVINHVDLYTKDRGLEWVVYANGTKLLWIPENKTLSGKEISSSSTELPLPGNETVRLYLFIRWG